MPDIAIITGLMVSIALIGVTLPIVGWSILGGSAQPTPSEPGNPEAFVAARERSALRLTPFPLKVKVPPTLDGESLVGQGRRSA